MEIIIGLVIVGLGAYFVFRKKEEVVEESQAPYKVETPEPAKCGCGRSASGFCVGLHKLTPEEWNVHADNPNRAPVAPKAKKAKDTAKTKKPKATTTKAPAKAKTPRKKKAAE